MENLKTFISYSWTSPEHESWVLNLATELREVGVDVILDKWDLKEGHDAIKFMEQMVANPEIKKVILICDHKYVEKTDGRSGGVGTEAQIISPAIYSKSDQDKFVAVTTEFGPDDKPYLPTYYKGRIYIDLSGDEVYAQNFEQLVRWIYGKPVHAKPALGKTPSFLLDGQAPGLANAALHRRAIDAIRNSKPYAKGAIDEYLDSCIGGLEAFRIAGGEPDFDDKVVKSIDDFLPHRSPLVELFVALAQYRDGPETRQQLHRFMERLLPFLDPPEGMNQWRETDFDNYAFIVHELFLYLVAILLRYECFESASHLMRQPFYVSNYRRRGSANIVGFTDIRRHLESLRHRNLRLKTNRSSLHADLLEKRSHASGVDLQHLMQADFVLFVRGALDVLRGSGEQWWPDVLLYSERSQGAFEIFARARSAEYFKNIVKLLDLKSKQDLAEMLKAISEGKLHSPKWNWFTLDTKSLLGFDQLAVSA